MLRSVKLKDRQRTHIEMRCLIIEWDLRILLHRLFHALHELLLQLFGKLVVGIDFQGFLIVLHYIHVVTLAILSWVLNDAHHIEEAA